MHNDEIDKFHKMINESYLKVERAKELHSMVDDFLDRDYGGISPEAKIKREKAFELRCIDIHLKTAQIETESVGIIVDKMRSDLHLILDKSVDLSKAEKGIIETIIGALPPIHIYLLNIIKKK